MKSSLSLSLVVVLVFSGVIASPLVCSIVHGSEWLVCQEEMRRLRLARRVLGIERRDDTGLLLLLDEEDDV